MSVINKGVPSSYFHTRRTAKELDQENTFHELYGWGDSFGGIGTNLYLESGSKTKEDMIKAAKKILNMGSKNVLLKGGHFKNKMIFDILVTKKKIKVFSLEEESIIGNFIACDIIDEHTGKIFYEAGYEIDEEFFAFIKDKKLKYLHILKHKSVVIMLMII